MSVYFRILVRWMTFFFFVNLSKSGFDWISSQRSSDSKFCCDNALRYIFLRRARLENDASQTYVEPNMHKNFGTMSLSAKKLHSDNKRLHNASLVSFGKPLSSFINEISNSKWVFFVPKRFDNFWILFGTQTNGVFEKFECQLKLLETGKSWIERVNQSINIPNQWLK